MLKLLSSLSLLTAILATGYPALAQSGTTNSTAGSSTMTKTESTTGTADERSMSLPEKLKLTSDQKKKIKNSVDLMKKNISAELTTEQRSQFEAALKRKSQVIPTLKTLNLSPEQNKKIVTVIKSMNAKVKAVLTPEQLKELQVAQADRMKK